MKFSAATVLALLGVSAEAKASHRIGAKKVLDKRALLSKAIPVDKNGNPRRLNQQQEEFEITADYSIQFNHCVSLKTQAQNEEYMFGDDTIELTQNGFILSQASYVLFNVCKTESSCYYDDDDENLYMADLGSYMESLMTIQFDDKQNYCEACQQSYDYCYPEGDDAVQDEGDNQDGENQNQDGENQDGENQNQEGDNQDGDNQDGDNQDGGERKRRRKLENGAVVEYIDCEKCAAMECFEDDAEEDQQYNGNQNAQVGEEDIVEWVQQMAECNALENGNWNGNEVYASFMCNDDGTGVEIGVFLDNECSVYTSLLSYTNLMAGSYEYSNYAYASADIVTYPFLNDIGCSQVEYMNPEEAANQEYDGNQQDDGEEPEASEYCRQVMENSVDLETCAADGNEEQQEEEQEEDNNYDWYTYDLSADDAEDIQAVCAVVQLYEGEYENAHTYKADDGEGGGSGNVYDYKSAQGAGGDGMNAGKIFGIVIAVVVIIVAGIMVAQSCSGKRDSKKVPLVNKSGGAMA